MAQITDETYLEQAQESFRPVKEVWSRWKLAHSAPEADWKQMSDVFDVRRKSLEERRKWSMWGSGEPRRERCRQMAETN
jgi:hypothetical protein